MAFERLIAGGRPPRSRSGPRRRCGRAVAGSGVRGHRTAVRPRRGRPAGGAAPPLRRAARRRRARPRPFRAGGAAAHGAGGRPTHAGARGRAAHAGAAPNRPASRRAGRLPPGARDARGGAGPGARPRPAGGGGGGVARRRGAELRPARHHPPGRAERRTARGRAPHPHGRAERHPTRGRTLPPPSRVERRPTRDRTPTHSTGPSVVGRERAGAGGGRVTRPGCPRRSARSSGAGTTSPGSTALLRDHPLTTLTGPGGRARRGWRSRSGGARQRKPCSSISARARSAELFDATVAEAFGIRFDGGGLAAAVAAAVGRRAR